MKNKLKKFVINIVVIIAVIYLAVSAAIYLMQRSLIFFPQKYTEAPLDVGLKDFEEVELTTADNVKIYGWYKKPEPGKSTIVYFDGNAGALPHNSELFHELTIDGTGLFGVAYRGYGKSAGKPTELGFYEDGRAVINYLKVQIPEKSIVVAGRSLGTGVAVQMATEFDLGGVILISPFTSVPDIAAYMYWYFPIKQLNLVRDKFDSISKIKKVTEPLLIIHGEKDFLIPIKFGQKLFKHANEPKKFSTHIDADHNHFETSKLASDIKEFLK